MPNPEHQALYIGYHGSAATPATFAPEIGAFFASKPETSERYGKNVAAYRLRMEMPARWTPELVDGFQEYVFNRMQEGFTAREIQQFAMNTARVGGDCTAVEEGMRDYVKALLAQPAKRITFSDTDPLFGLLRDHLIAEGHDGLIRPHEISDGIQDGALEYIPFSASQIAPLLGPEVPPPVAQTKLVDGRGHPQVLYRGEGSGNYFERFDRRNTNERGFFFTPDREIAAKYDREASPRAFLVAAERILDLTKDTMRNRKWVESWGKNFDDWTDRASGEPTDAFTVLEGGRMFDYEGNWSAERWKDLQASAERDGYDAVILPDHDNALGVFPSVVVFRPEQVWQIRPPAREVEKDGEDRALLAGAATLPIPCLTAAEPVAPGPDVS